MCWYIIFGCIAFDGVIFVLVGIIQEIHDNNKSYKKRWTAIIAMKNIKCGTKSHKRKKWKI